MLGLGVRAGATFLGGPLVGAGVGRAINTGLTNYQNRNQIGQPDMGGIPQQPNPGVSVPNVGMNPGMNLGFPGAIGRPPMGGVSNFGPYAGGYGFGPQAPTTSGLPNTQTSYGVSLPNYGGPTGPANFGGQPQGPLLTPQQQAEADRLAKNNSYGSQSMFATGGVRQEGAAVNLLGTGGKYLK